MNIKKLGLFGVLICVLAACSTAQPRGSVKNPQLVAQPEKVTIMLAEAADRASRSLETLAAVEKTRTPGAEVASIPNAPQELQRTFSTRWYGPVEQLTEQVAARAGYTFETFGNKPATPIIVTLNAEDRQLINILRDIGLQIGQQGELKVDASRRAVELYYPQAIEPISNRELN